MEKEKTFTLSTLYKRFDKLLINKQELSEVLGISLSTINRRISVGRNLPPYQKESSGSKVMFRITDVAVYIDELPTKKIY